MVLSGCGKSFAFRYCSVACKCVDCANTLEAEPARKKAVTKCLQRNSKAFKPKIETPSRDGGKCHTVGCRCKKTRESTTCKLHLKGARLFIFENLTNDFLCLRAVIGCVKKYCECFNAGIACTDRCVCSDCENLPTPEKHRKAPKRGMLTVKSAARRRVELS